MKTKKPKTRLGWAWPAHLRSPRPFLVLNNKLAARGCEEMARIATIDLSDPEALVMIGAESLYGNQNWREQQMRDALTALGILPKKRKGAK